MRCTPAARSCVRYPNWLDSPLFFRPLPVEAQEFALIPGVRSVDIASSYPESPCPRRLSWHRSLVPVAGTKVGFTVSRENHTLSMSSSGGGLFGRPVTRKSSGRFLFTALFASLVSCPALHPQRSRVLFLATS